MDKEILEAETSLTQIESENAEEAKGDPDILAALRQEIGELATVEDRLHFAVGALRTTLAQTGTPQFRQFWEIRNLCLALFKEGVNPTLRAIVWEEYSALCKEARHLKEILDEQSAFAAEQIDVAIAALEGELLAKPLDFQQLPEPEWVHFSKFLELKKQSYSQFQQELSFLNTHASRINSLRKELIKTEMRIRTKNQFFRRLSALGDRIFPRRKELIKELSAFFALDIQEFVSRYFPEEGPQGVFYYLRDEIKSLQALAKALTLNTHSFTETRALLSQCWDKVKAGEQEYKKELQSKKEAFKENEQNLNALMNTLEERLKQEELTTNQAYDELHKLSIQVNDLELGMKERKTLRGRLAEIRRDLSQKAQQQEERRQEEEREYLRGKRARVEEKLQEVRSLIAEISNLSAAIFIERAEALLAEITSSSLIKSARQEFAAALNILRDHLSEAHEKMHLETVLSSEDQQALVELQSVLKQRKERRHEVKAKLEEYRKAAGRSGLAFDQAIAYGEMMNTEKERLEKINSAIQEIEDRIADMRG